jgi:GH25 family lysozyme M1 (1,4-beta-N-acetylmuramidase)
MPAGDSSIRHRRRSLRRTITAALGGLTAVLALVLTAPGAATAASHPTAYHPERDWMGSTVAAHEGGGKGSPVVITPNSASTWVEGVDVSSHNGNVDWLGLWNSGVRWAYVKATENTNYQNPYFAQQYNGSYNVGMIRGSYHFATPNTSSGAAQAQYFVAHGGGWSGDGKTLPGALDIEYNPYGSTCYGLSQSAMVNWIADFVNTYRALTSRDATIYSTTDWWTTCTGNSGAFGSTDPLWIARYSSSVGTLPAGWGFYTFWQYTSTGPIVGDHSHFNGAYDRLQALANG